VAGCDRVWPPAWAWPALGTVLVVMRLLTILSFLLAAPFLAACGGSETADDSWKRCGPSSAFTEEQAKLAREAERSVIKMTFEAMRLTVGVEPNQENV